jgi:hypothetical protein
MTRFCSSGLDSPVGLHPGDAAANPWHRTHHFFAGMLHGRAFPRGPFR